jgi:hypothetical protein
MPNQAIFDWIHVLVPTLLQPIAVALMLAAAVAVFEIGLTACERWQLRKPSPPADLHRVERRAHRRIERADILTRAPPMLGLMATLIALGPGLKALSKGDFDLLAAAMLTAFDTTVLGLAVGIVGFITGRLRRRWYDEALTRWERAS